MHSVLFFSYIDSRNSEKVGDDPQDTQDATVSHSEGDVCARSPRSLHHAGSWPIRGVTHRAYRSPDDGSS